MHPHIFPLSIEPKKCSPMSFPPNKPQNDEEPNLPKNTDIPSKGRIQFEPRTKMEDLYTSLVLIFPNGASEAKN